MKPRLLAAAATVVWLAAPGFSQSGEISPFDLISLTGRVEGPGGVRLPGVVVTLRRAETRRVEDLAQTDADGIFRFHALPHPRYELEATVRGIGRALKTVETGGDNSVYSGVLVLTASGASSQEEPASVVGSVSVSGWAGNNCSGAELPKTLIWLRIPGGDVVSVTTTDRNGVFVFPGIPPGRYDVETEQEWRFRASARAILVREGEDLDIGQRYFTITLPGLCDVVVFAEAWRLPVTSVRLTGRVSTFAGAAIKASMVMENSSPAAQARTDRKGAFQMTVPPGYRDLLIRAKGFRTMRRHLFIDTWNADVELPEIVLNPETRSGR